MEKLTKDEWRVLKWISREDVSPVFPVEGDAFRHLIALGAVEVQGEATFLTDYGWELITDAREAGDEASDLDAMARA